MASDSEAECHGSADAGEPPNLDDMKIVTVQAVRFGEKVWYLDTQIVEGETFFKVSKHDRVLTKLVMGKAVQRHTKRNREKNTLSLKKFWRDVASLRKQACDAAVRRVLEDARAAAADGREPPPRIREAREGDEYLLHTRAVQIALPDLEAFPGHSCKMVWQLKGDLWMELNVENLRYVLLALRESPEVQPPTPKRRRRKRKASTPRRSAEKDVRSDDSPNAVPPGAPGE